MTSTSYFLEKPDSWRLDSRLVRFCGWVCNVPSSETISIVLNGVLQPNVQFIDRPDAASWAGADTATGWRIFCDAASISTADQGAITLEIFVGEKLLSRNYFRVHERYRREPETILFMHIPKTAGTSLRTALEEALPKEEFLSVYDEQQDFISVSEFKRLPSSALSETKYVFGHFPYGLHSQLEGPFRYVTFLREPFDHLLSSYRFSFLWESNKDRSIDETLEFGGYHFDNPQTRYLAGRCDDAPIGQSDLAKAIDHLSRHFAVVGVAEHFAASIDRISRLIGCPLPARWDNKTPPSPQRDFIDMAQFRTAAASRVTLDLELYNWVLNRFWADAKE